jgi:hypothetical protein
VKTRFLVAGLIVATLLALAGYVFLADEPPLMKEVTVAAPAPTASSGVMTKAETVKSAPARVSIEVAPSLEEYLDTAFTQEWVEQWFGGRCEESSRPGYHCSLDPAKAIALGPAADEDMWVKEALGVLTAGADSAKRSRPGSDYRIKCNASGCILVFATALPGPFVKADDLPGFSRHFAADTDIHWQGCPGCWNANVDLVMMVRRSARQ